MQRCFLADLLKVAQEGGELSKDWVGFENNFLENFHRLLYVHCFARRVFFLYFGKG